MSFFEKRKEEKELLAKQQIIGLVLFGCGIVMLLAVAYDFYTSGRLSFDLFFVLGIALGIVGGLKYDSACKEIKYIKEKEEREALEKYRN